MAIISAVLLNLQIWDCSLTGVIAYFSIIFFFIIHAIPHTHTNTHRPHRDFHAFKWTSWTVPFSHSYYTALPFSVLYPISELSCKQTQLKKKIKLKNCALYQPSVSASLTLCAGRNPFSCLPSSFRCFHSFCYLCGSAASSSLLLLLNKPLLTSTHIFVVYYSMTMELLFPNSTLCFLP